jgi:uncharacterized protein YdeI (YjbR/CyaY-like superfamily)
MAPSKAQHVAGRHCMPPRRAIALMLRLERRAMAAKKKTKKSKTPAPAPKPSRARTPKVELPVLSFATPAQFVRWLKAEPEGSSGLWLRLGKKGRALQTLSYQQALDVALAWGWIDGQLKAHDEQSWLRKFVPRSHRSIWSKINRSKALALIESGRMQPAGLLQVRRAQQDGRWDAAYDSPSNAEPAADFSAALAASPRAAAFFEQLERRNRYAVLFRIQAARKPETRARKIRELVAMLERGEKIHP